MHVTSIYAVTRCIEHETEEEGVTDVEERNRKIDGK